MKLTSLLSLWLGSSVIALGGVCSGANQVRSPEDGLVAPGVRAASSPAGRGGRGGRRYAIVVAKKTLEDAAWKSVVEALKRKHSAAIFHWDEGGAKGLRRSWRRSAPAACALWRGPTSWRARARCRFGLVLGVPSNGRSVGCTTVM